MLSPGQQLGSYEVGEVLGEGGFAWVYSARHSSLGHTVALKVLLPHIVAKEGLRARFLDEARVQANLRHPHIVTVHDILAEPGVAAMVLEYAPGGSLADRLEDGALAPEQVRAVGAQLLSALGYAHAAGVVHRDVKPDNVLLRDTGLHTLLGDFGIARVRGELRGNRASTLAGGVMGTLAYASPEQLEDPTSVDERSDLWSAAVLLLEAVTGEHPFAADTDLSMMKKIMEAAPVIPDALRRRDPALVAALQGALHAEPDERWNSAEEFATALARRDVPAARQPASVTTSVPQAAVHQTPAPRTPAPRPPTPRPPHAPPSSPSSPLPWVMGFAGLLAVAGVLWIGFSRSPGSTASSPASTSVPQQMTAAAADPRFPASGAGGALIVATGERFPPYYDFSSGSAEGFDIEVAEDLARRLGKAGVRFVPGKGVRARVQAGSADLGVAAISVTPAREKETLFSAPYLDSSFVAVTSGGPALGGLADLRCSVWGAHALYRGLLERTGCTLVKVDGHDAALDSVRRGAADFTVVDRANAQTLPAPLRATDTVLGSDHLGVAMKRGNRALKSAVDVALQDMRGDGTLTRLKRKYGL